MSDILPEWAKTIWKTTSEELDTVVKTANEIDDQYPHRRNDIRWKREKLQETLLRKRNVLP